VEPNWDFVTDESGRCVVKLRDAKWDGLNSIPGWGTYAIRVDGGPDDAGAFSPFLIHEEDEWSRKDEMQRRKQLEWGRPIIVARRKMDLTLRLEPGFTIRGRVLRYPGGEPWPEVEVSGAYDLYAESHTGHGGEVPGPTATTDAEGRFTLRQIYPSKYFLQLSKTWLQTKRDRGPWVTDCLDQIEPARGQSIVSLQIVATAGKPFRVFGHVQDAAHHPLAGAQVGVGHAAHRRPYEWHEEQDEHVATDAAGNYEAWIAHPWVMDITVNAGQHPETEFPGSNEGIARFRPGRYDFTLK
jgi:hypothetical protein